MKKSVFQFKYLKKRKGGRSNSKISGKNSLIFQIETVANKATEKIEAIKKIYSEIYEDDNENLSIKTLV